MVRQKQRLSDKEKLDRLGLSERDFENYQRLFIGDRWRYVKRDSQRDTWRTLYFPLQDGTVLYHLQGRYWIGNFGRPVTEAIAIDLDKGKDLFDRYELVLKTINQEPLIFESSKSGGLHLYYRLDTVQPTRQVSQIIERFLETKGIRVESGKIEIYPSTARALRLPLGRDSYLLDSDLRIMADRPEAMRQVSFLVEFDKLDRLSLPELEYNLTLLKKAEGRGIIQPPKDSKGFYGEIQMYFDKGITGPGIRHEVMDKLLWFWHCHEGLGGQELEELGCRWLDKHHNGNSKDYNHNPNFCYDEIRRSARCLEKYDLRPEAVKPSKVLSLEDVHGIRKLTQDHKRQRFLFELLNFSKRRGVREPQRDLSLVKGKNEGRFKIQLPQSVMQKWPHCSRDRYLKYRKWAEEKGILELVAYHGADIKRARQYYVNWEFRPGKPVKQFHRW